MVQSFSTFLRIQNILCRDGNFALPCLTHPSSFHPTWVFPAPKGGGAGMGQDFSPAPRGKAGMSLDFLDQSRPTPPHPHPAPSKGFSYSRTLPFKQIYQY